MGCIPKRYLIVLLACLSLMLIMLLDLNHSILMIRWSDNSINKNAWSHIIYGIGTLTSFAGGVVGNRYGGAVVFGSAMLLSAGNNMLLEFLARVHFAWTLIGRFLDGVFHALMYSSIADVWSRWSPLEHRSKYVSLTVAGQYVAIALRNWILPLQDVMHSNIEPHVFRSTAIVTAILATIWLLVVKNDPSEDRSLSQNERAILEPRLKFLDKKSVALNNYPWSQILMSKPVWALNVATFVFSISNFFVITILPTFLLLSSSDADNTLYSKLPYLMSLHIFINVLKAGYISDRFTNRNTRKNTKVLKLIVCVSFVAEGTLLLLLNLFQFNFKIAMILLALILTFRSFSEIPIQVNAIDLSPRYASLLNGIQRSFFELGKIIITAIVYFYSYKLYSTPFLGIWCINILIALHFGGALLYYVWGSGELQSWNSSSKEGHELGDRKNSTNI